MSKGKVSRRNYVKYAAAGVVIVGGAAAGAYYATRPRYEKPKELTILMWEAYWVEDIIKPFEDMYDVTLKGAWFDENSEVFARLKAGGWRDFDLVMGDAYWPSLYGENGWVLPVDNTRLENYDLLFPVFKPPEAYMYNGQSYASPNCWGGYGITTHKKYLDETAGNALISLYNDEYSGHIAIAERSQENIAVAGICAGHYNNWNLDPRFGPWRLTDDQLETVKEMLLYQKSLLMARYISVAELARWLEEESVWIATDWFDGFGLAYEAGVDVRYNLFPAEGGLGWVDGYCMTKGVEGNEGKIDLCHKWFDYILSPEVQLKLMHLTGHSVVCDIRDQISDQDRLIYNMDRTEDFKRLALFQAPDRPDVWEKVFSDVLALPATTEAPEWIKSAV